MNEGSRQSCEDMGWFLGSRQGVRLLFWAECTQFLVQDFLHQTLEINMSIFNSWSTKMAYWVIILPLSFTVLPTSPVAVAGIVWEGAPWRFKTRIDMRHMHAYREVAVKKIRALLEGPWRVPRKIILRCIKRIGMGFIRNIRIEPRHLQTLQKS